MSVNIKTNIANKGNYGGSRSLDSIKYIVVHYTGNDGDTDENNGNYFKNNITQTSAHYFVDDDSVTQTVYDNYVAWHCGGSSYKHQYCRNSNSIGVEICDDVMNGTIYPSAATIRNALELVEYLMKKYSIPKANVIRHYDVTGKICPGYWSGSAAKDAKWKTEFWNKLGTSEDVVISNDNDKPADKPVEPEGILYRVQVGAYSIKENAIKMRDELKAKGYNDAFIATTTIKSQVNNSVTVEKKSIDEIAHEVLDGKWGNGEARINNLTNAGYDYNAVQNRVNEILGY